jgi:cyclic pyranopterin monophosphate synthase
MSTSSHFDEAGQARMVDVSAKESTVRVAVARGKVTMKASTAEMIQRGNADKGDVLAVARLAGIGATKLTSMLIPLCHAIPIESVTVDFSGPEPVSDSRANHGFDAEITCLATVKTTAKTGVEMEAMTAVSVACLTIYDMVKGVERGVKIGRIELIEKTGGKSGHFKAAEK